MAYDEADLDEDGEADDKRDHSDDALKKKFVCWDREVMDAQSMWAREARMCYDMVAGDQWDKEAVEQLKLQEIAPITWNRVQPLVDAVSGAQIQNRHEIKFYPREIGDASVSEILTAAAEWVADEGDFEDEETDAFFDALVCGLGWTETRMDYEDEPDGEIRKDRVDPLEMRWDPSARKRNLADARYFRRTRPFSKEQFRDRFPEWADEITSSSDEGENPSYSSENPGDDYPETDNADSTQKNNKHEIFVKEYQWYEVEEYKRVYDTVTRQEDELRIEEYQNLLAMLQKIGADPNRIDEVGGKRKVFYRAFCADGRILDYERLHCKGFTYHAITGKRDRNKGTWYGLVRAMVDPQRWANKWMTQILVIVNKNAKGGAFFETGALVDPVKAEEDWALPDPLIEVNPGALASGGIKERTAPPYPQGMDRMIQMAISSIRDVTGINQELLGMVDRDQPGILEAQRKEAGYAMLSMFFDSLRRYRKMSGRLLLEYIQKYMSPETLIRVIGEEGQMQYVPLGLQDETARYDIIVDEAPSGPNQKDKVWAMWVQMMPILTRNPIPPQIWAEMVKWSPLPQSVGQKIAQMLLQASQPTPQQQQAAQKQQQMQDQAFMAEVRNTNADSMKKEAEAKAALMEAPLKQTEQQISAMKAAGELQRIQGVDRQAQMDLAKTGAEMQASVSKNAAEIRKADAQTAYTNAQTKQQVVETIITQLRALTEDPAETRLNVNT